VQKEGAIFEEEGSTPKEGERRRVSPILQRDQNVHTHPKKGIQAKNPWKSEKKTEKGFPEEKKGEGTTATPKRGGSSTGEDPLSPRQHI